MAIVIVSRDVSFRQKELTARCTMVLVDVYTGGTLTEFPPRAGTLTRIPDDPEVYKHSQFFGIPLPETRYLWGLDDLLKSAIRCSLEGRPEFVQQRLNAVVATLQVLAQSAANPFESQDTEWHTTEIHVPHTHPFQDF